MPSPSSSACSGPAGDSTRRATGLLERAVAPLRPEGRPLFAGLRSQWDDPDDPWTRFFHLGDMLREYRGDAHVAAWTSDGLDATEIGLFTEAYIGLPLRTYVRTRAWNDAELDAATEALEARGWMQGDAMTDAGRDAREAHRAQRPTVPCVRLWTRSATMPPSCSALLEPWGAAMREAGGYIGGPVDLWPTDRR